MSSNLRLAYTAEGNKNATKNLRGGSVEKKWTLEERKEMHGGEEI